MVTIETVRASNRALKTGTRGLVALFIGATRGIGLSTVQQLIKNLDTPIFYIVGRSETAFSSQLGKLKELNPEASIQFFETEISLLKNVDSISKRLIEKEKKLDLLFMSPGFLPLGGPTYTIEGIDTCMSVSYYARIRLTMNLLPLLQNSISPRVLSVLAGGKERRLLTQDLGLKDNYSFLNVIDQTTTMHTLAFERLAQRNPSISFLHAYPGWVQTDIVQNAWLSSARLPGWLVWFGNWIFHRLFLLLATSVDECGERQAFHATSPRYSSQKHPDEHFSDSEVSGGKAHGTRNRVSLVAENGTTSSNQQLIERYRAEGMIEKVWGHTINVFTEILSSDENSEEEKTQKMD